MCTIFSYHVYAPLKCSILVLQLKGDFSKASNRLITCFGQEELRNVVSRGLNNACVLRFSL